MIEPPQILITQDLRLGWVMAKVIPQYKEMQIWHQFGTWENVSAFIDWLVEWRAEYLKTVQPDKPPTDIPSAFKKWEEDELDKKEDS